MITSQKLWLTIKLIPVSDSSVVLISGRIVVSDTSSAESPISGCAGSGSASGISVEFVESIFVIRNIDIR